ncbi:hypothetical protein MD484_g8949, partial [Candolleomyces efflorescens]
MERVQGRGGKSVAQDFKTWPILHGRRFFNNLTVDWDGPEAILAPHGSPAPALTPDDDGSEVDPDEDDDGDDDIVVEQVSANTKAALASKAVATQQALVKLTAAKKALARSTPKPPVAVTTTTSKQVPSKPPVAVTTTTSKQVPPPAPPPPSSISSTVKKAPALPKILPPPSGVLIDLSSTRKVPAAPPVFPAPAQASSANIDDPFISKSGSQPTEAELAAAAKVLGFYGPPPRTKANLKAARAAAAASSSSSLLSSSAMTSLSSSSSSSQNLKRSAVSPEPKLPADNAKRIRLGPAASLLPNLASSPAIAAPGDHNGVMTVVRVLSELQAASGPGGNGLI